jgi:hypothetical protein
MPSTDKYCEDCKFCVRDSAPIYSKCSAPGAEPAGPGRFVARELDVPPYASTMRISGCGPDAKWFEAKTEAAVA